MPSPLHAETLFDGKTTTAFAFEVVEKGEKEGRKLPYFRAFPAGQDKDGNDVAGTLSTLKFARGKSQLYPAEDAAPGLIVVLRRMVLTPKADGSYEAVLEGEFNAVRSPISKEVIAKLKRGEVAEMEFKSDTTKGVRPLSFRVLANTNLRAALVDGKLVVYGGQGTVSISQYTFTGTYTYESVPIAFGPEGNTKPIYLGNSVEPVIKSDGKVETLPIIN